jgi:hypothetical protein
MARQPAAEKSVSKAKAYRDAAAVLGKTADLNEVQEFIKQKYGILMEKTQISQYRNNEKKKKGKGRKQGKAPAADAAPKASKPVKEDSLIEFVGAVRSWENKIGAEKICEMIAALYQR